MSIDGLTGYSYGACGTNSIGVGVEPLWGWRTPILFSVSWVALSLFELSSIILRPSLFLAICVLVDAVELFDSMSSLLIALRLQISVQNWPSQTGNCNTNLRDLGAKNDYISQATDSQSSLEKVGN